MSLGKDRYAPNTRLRSPTRLKLLKTLRHARLRSDIYEKRRLTRSTTPCNRYTLLLSRENGFVYKPTRLAEPKVVSLPPSPSALREPLSAFLDRENATKRGGPLPLITLIQIDSCVKRASR